MIEFLISFRGLHRALISSFELRSSCSCSGGKPEVLHRDSKSCQDLRALVQGVNSGLKRLAKIFVLLFGGNLGDRIRYRAFSKDLCALVQG